MKICRFPYTDIPDLPHSVLAAGFFDGFHKGHRALLKEAAEKARQLGLPWGVLTFDPDPWTIFRPDDPLDHIQTLADRQQTARTLGADLFLIVEFTRSFAALSPDGFHRFLEQMHADYIVTGFDFHYGARNAGDVQSLAAAGFAHSVVEAVRDTDGKISSTRIEAAIRAGDVQAAARMLEQDYSIPGTVVHGYGRGSRLLGFPTANLEPEPGCIIPAAGVYAGFVRTDAGMYPAMINVGSNPTFGNGHQTLEACLFGFSGDLYDRQVRFFFSERLRGEIRFESPAQLKQQLEQDRERSLMVLQGHDPDPLHIFADEKSGT